MGKRGPQPQPLRELLFWEGLWYWVFQHLRGDSAPSDAKLAMNMNIKNQLRAERDELAKFVANDTIQEYWLEGQKADLERDLKRKPQDSEPAVWRDLIAAKTAADIRKACRASTRWLSPKWQGRPYVQDLYDKAQDFVRAKTENIYYPRRDSNDEKRVAFFARAMAGISLGISPNTAIDRLRKYKHGDECPCVHCDQSRWDRIEQHVYTDFFAKSADEAQAPPARKLRGRAKLKR